MAKKKQKRLETKHVSTLNSEQIETLINNVVMCEPFSVKRKELLITLFTKFLIPSINIHPDKDNIQSIPAFDIVVKDKPLYQFLLDYNNLLVRVTSKSQTYLCISNPLTYEIIEKNLAPLPIIPLGETFTLPEEMCGPGMHTKIHLLFIEYLFFIKQTNDTSPLITIITAYLNTVDMWFDIPENIKPAYKYLSPLDTTSMFQSLGYPTSIVKELNKTVKHYYKKLETLEKLDDDQENDDTE